MPTGNRSVGHEGLKTDRLGKKTAQAGCSGIKLAHVTRLAARLSYFVVIAFGIPIFEGGKFFIDISNRIIATKKPQLQ